MFELGSPEKNLAIRVEELVHREKKLEAAQEIDAFCKLGLKLADDDPEKYLPVLLHWLHFLLNSGAPREAATLLWKKNKFSPEPKFTRDTWKLFDEASLGIVMGGASCSKSYGLGGVRFFLEWVRDPANTSVRIIGPSEDHLEANLFSHLVDLHASASLPMPGKVGELFLGLDRRNQVGSIKGIVIPKGDNKKAGRLQGVKRKARSKPHAMFGSLTRLFIFVDEAENVPGGIYGDIDNVISNVQGETGGFKIFLAFNPKDLTSPVASLAEPPFGWNNLDVNEHFRWTSVRGWEVLRLDGERCENVTHNKIIYPGLQTKAGLEAIARNAGGRESPGYLSMGRGMYPKQGAVLQLIPDALLHKSRGEFIWYENSQPVAAADLALSGGDSAVYILGKWGKVTGIKYPASRDHPQGRKVMFKDKSGNSIVRWGLQADQLFTVPKGDSVEMARRLIELNRKAGVRGEFFACDRTGVGAGIADLMRHEWSQSIHDVNYSEAASDGKLMQEDSKTCKEQFERINSELLFALRSWMEFQYVLLNPALDCSKLGPQTTNRRFRSSGGKSRAESKKEYQDRMPGGESPNELDALTLLVHAARKGSGQIFSMRLDESGDIGIGEEDWGYEEYKGGAKIDVTNRTDYLEQLD